MSQPISHLLTIAKYKHPEHTRQDILNTTKYVRTLLPKIEKYIFPTGVSKELICLGGTIPVTFKDATYNIPVGIYISDNHPFEAPLCYVRPTKDMTIKPSQHVDANGRVYLPYLSEWNKNTSDILSTLQVMQITFSQMCPVYQKATSYDNPSDGNAVMPPSLPSSSNTGTITDDRVKHGLREEERNLREEIEILKRTFNDLTRGKMQLDNMKTRMAQEISSLTEAKEKLHELDGQLQGFIAKYDKDDHEVDPDEVYGPTQPRHKQLLDAYAEELAIQDAIYYIGEALSKKKISLPESLKAVRDLSRRLFMLRALIMKLDPKAGG